MLPRLPAGGSGGSNYRLDPAFALSHFSTWSHQFLAGRAQLWGHPEAFEQTTGTGSARIPTRGGGDGTPWIVVATGAGLQPEPA